MSLINQMLKDLESRRASDELAQRAVDGMGAARHKPKKQGTLLLVLVVLIAVLASISGYLLLMKPPKEGAQQVAATSTSSTVAEKQKETTKVVKQPVAPVTKPPRQPQKPAPLVKKSPTIPLVRETPVETSKLKAAEEESATSYVEAPKKTVTAPKEEFSTQIKKRLRPQSNEQLAEKQYQRGYALLQSGDKKGAEEAWRRALKIYGKHAASRESLAILYLSQSRHIEATEQLQKGLNANPGNGKLALLYARMQLEGDDLKGAVITLERTMRSQSQSADYHAFLAAVYQRKGDFSKSITAYQVALKQQQNQPVWWMGLGISLESAGMPKEALTA